MGRRYTRYTSLKDAIVQLSSRASRLLRAKLHFNRSDVSVPRWTPVAVAETPTHANSVVYFIVPVPDTHIIVKVILYCIRSLKCYIFLLILVQCLFIHEQTAVKPR